MSHREAVIVAAHGSRHGNAAAIVNGHVERLRREYALEAFSAFHVGRPGFGRVLGRLETGRGVIVPFFAADGYYSRRVLPDAVAGSRLSTGIELRQTRAVGTAPQLPDLVRNRVLQLTGRLGLKLERTSILVVGHGTPRHPASRVSTGWVADRLSQTSLFRTVAAAFLAEPPAIEEQLELLPADQKIVVPYLIGGGSHVLEDLPRRLGFRQTATLRLGSTPESRASPVRVGLVDGCLVVIDRALGEDPSLTRVIAALAAGPACPAGSGVPEGAGT